MEHDYDEDDETLLEVNKKLAEHYFFKKEMIHCSLKSGQFYNGRIFSIQPEFFEIHDREEGVQVVFFMELKNRIVLFKERGE